MYRLSKNDRVSHYFTFGQVHMANYTLPKAGRLADFWVEVNLPLNHEVHHREIFIRDFTTHYCPRPSQFAFEYEEGTLKKEHFPGGQLCLITEEGIQNA